MSAKKATDVPTKKIVVKTTIVYRCDPEHLNLEGVLESLREYGSAEILSVTAEEAP